MNNQISGILRLVILFSIFYSGSVIAQDNSALDKTSEREHISMDFDWRFQFGFANDAGKDFSSGTSYFSYFAKTGYGDGPAAQFFDDRSWRKINVPHDWAVE